jgi:hypothetical protein
MRPVRVSWILAALGATACRVYGPGLPPPTDAGVDQPAPPPASPDAAGGPSPDLRPPVERPLFSEPPGTPGPASVVGCSDGTREGFPVVADWPDIAGCSGAWQVPGVIGEQGENPRCGRLGGNDGERFDGIDCSVADLCADGWHVCRDPADVMHRSRTGCECAVAVGQARMFIVAAGASPLGACVPGLVSSNDLHGCGRELGPGENTGCSPLVMRMSFVDCARSGVWSCGTADDHLGEANVVVKNGSPGGGVLCCRD